MGRSRLVQQTDSGKKAPVVYSASKVKVHPKEAFRIFNGNIAAICGDNNRRDSVLKTRCLALEDFLQRYKEKHRIALFLFFQEWMPHWECTKEFSVENLFVFVRKISCSHFFLIHHYKPSITAPKHKKFVSHATKEKTAVVRRKRASCVACPDKDAVDISSKKLQICRGCATLLGKSISKGLISEKASAAKILSFLKIKREEQRKRHAMKKRRNVEHKKEV